MNEDGAPWESLALDMNGDGRFTIADLWAWLEHLLFLPGDVVLSLVLTHAPALAAFFELNADHYGTPVTKFLSVAIWLAGFVLIGMVINAFRNLDRVLTSYVSGRYQELRRQLRVLRRKLTSRIGMLRQRRRARATAVTVDAVALERLETAVLRCHANVDDFAVLTADEVAAALRLPVRQVHAALRRLIELCLVERSFGTDEGREGHRITQAGQIYLIDQ